MKPLSTRALLSACLVFLATGAPAAAEQSPASSLLAVGTEAPDFTAVRADDAAVKLSDFRGKVVLLDFWAPWCGPCRASMPHMEALHQKLESQGLVVLGVCVLEQRRNFNAWMKKPAVATSYLKVYDPAGRKAGNLAQGAYRLTMIPTFYLVDREGKIAFAGAGIDSTTKASLENALETLGFEL